MRPFPLLKPRHRRAALLFVWLLVLCSWFVWRVDDVGGRPLVILWGDDPGEYDPHRTSHPIAADVFQHVCEPLFYEDFAGVLRGLLAEDEIEYDAHGQQLTIRIRPDITFHDGTPLDAHAVEASFARLKRLGVSPLLNELRDVTVSALPDGRGVVFVLPEPDYEFPRLVLSNPYAAIVFALEENAAPVEWVACTGPFRFAPETYQPERALTLVRYDAYHWPPAYFANQGATSVPQIRFVFEAARAARLTSFMEGEGCVLSLSREHLDAVAAQPRFRRYQAMGGITYLGFNFQYARWQDIRARQAVALAIDRQAMLEPVFQIAETPLTPNTIGYAPETAAFGYNYDPARSRALFRQIGFDMHAEMVLLIPESNTYRQIAGVVQEQLREAGFTNVFLREVPRADILTQRQDFDLLLFDYAWGDYTALEIFLGPGPRNLLSYGDNRIAALIQQARM
ncbi:MAG: ABC transporter substrate-binding protein, partial [Anaerolineales bacterium]